MAIISVHMKTLFDNYNPTLFDIWHRSMRTHYEITSHSVNRKIYDSYILSYLLLDLRRKVQIYFWCCPTTFLHNIHQNWGTCPTAKWNILFNAAKSGVSLYCQPQCQNDYPNLDHFLPVNKNILLQRWKQTNESPWYSWWGFFGVEMTHHMYLCPDKISLTFNYLESNNLLTSDRNLNFNKFKCLTKI
jgi:hypothetical protein